MFVFLLQLRDTFVNAPRVPVHDLRRAGVGHLAAQGAAVAPVPAVHRRPPTPRRRWSSRWSTSRWTCSARCCAGSSSRSPTRSSSSSTARATRSSEQVCDDYPGVRWIWTPIAGQAQRRARSASSRRAATSSCWSTPTRSGRRARSRELVKPFADADIGGVTTRAADPRPRALRPHPLGRLAGEQSAASTRCPRMSVLGTGRAACPAARSRSAGTMLDRRHAGVHDRAVPRRVPRGLRRPDADEPDASSRATGPSTSRRAWSTPTPRCSGARWPSSSCAGRAAASTTRCGCCPG